jgi:hypothetical protein
MPRVITATEGHVARVLATCVANEHVAADVGTIDGARRACEGASIAYHCAQPDYTKWLQLFPPMTHAILDGAAAAAQSWCSRTTSTHTDLLTDR